MSRDLATVFLTCLLAISVQGQTVTPKVDDISGEWILTEQFPDETHTHRLNLKVVDAKITGQSGSSKLEGAIANSVITLKWLNPDGSIQATFTGATESGSLRGEGEWNGVKLKWSARRPAAKPTGGPRTHTFTPTEFQRRFSYAVPPVLRIFPGDTVKTKSVDAGGTDENSVRRSMGGNPLTGPFFIEGAIPGDTLVIKLNRVRTNRNWAVSGQAVVGNALGPGYLRNLKMSENFSSRWLLDAVKGIAHLEKPTDP